MKKILAVISFITFALPAAAACPIEGGACSVSLSDWESPSLQEKLIPNNLKNLQRSDIFQHGYQKPYHEALINTEEDSVDVTPKGSSNYNSNCQFGVCLPGVNPGESVLE